MLIIPAIDLKDGKVVRLYQGKGQETVYSDDPVEVAQKWQREGAKLIHVVDLDGAFSGEPKNLSVIREICDSIEIPIECGGGIRDRGSIRKLLGVGVEKIVLGTKAVEDQEFLKEVFSEFPEKIIVSIDARSGMVMTDGWKTPQPTLDAVNFSLRIKAIGFESIIYTDTLKDGTLTGPNIDGIKNLLSKSGLQVIASGGISRLDDIKRLKEIEKEGLAGVIVGKALYEKRFTLKEALEIAKKEDKAK
jgi:phosphoribosylformimino-5-aminoimidazole carboxamide ribotide isomerase